MGCSHTYGKESEYLCLDKRARTRKREWGTERGEKRRNVCMCVCACACVYVCACVFVRMRVHVYMCVRACMWKRVRLGCQMVYARTRARTHARTHACTYTI